MLAQKAAIYIPQPELTAERLATLLQSLSRADCQKMAEAAYAIGRRDANDAIAHVLEELAGTI